MFYILGFSKFVKQSGLIQINEDNITMLLHSNFNHATQFLTKEEAEKAAQKVINGIFTSYSIISK